METWASLCNLLHEGLVFTSFYKSGKSNQHVYIKVCAFFWLPCKPQAQQEAFMTGCVDTELTFSQISYILLFERCHYSQVLIALVFFQVVCYTYGMPLNNTLMPGVVCGLNKNYSLQQSSAVMHDFTLPNL